MLGGNRTVSAGVEADWSREVTRAPVISPVCLRQCLFLPMQCYSSTVLTMALCLSVTSRFSVETAERIELGFGMGSFLRPMLYCCEEIWAPPKI